MRGLSQRFELRQSQTLIMTPRLQQAIKMLQLSHLELTDFVYTEVQQNPLLELQERLLGEDALIDGVGDAERMTPRTVLEMLTGEIAAEAAADWQPEWGENSDRTVDIGGEPQPWQSRNGGTFGENRLGFDQTITRPRSLREHLLEQIGADLSDQHDRLIALHLLDLVDDDGYLRASLDEVRRLLECASERVECVLARLQQFDPVGVFARDLRECLTLQLRDRNRLDPAIQALLDNLELLADCVAGGDIAALVRVSGVDAADVEEMIREILSLDPTPGHAFDPPLAQPVVPDILMREHPKGGWVVELNAETLPRVLVNNSYYARVRRAARSKADKDYLSARLRAAEWLVEALHERATTILKVGAEIVRQQEVSRRFDRSSYATSPMRSVKARAQSAGLPTINTSPRRGVSFSSNISSPRRSRHLTETARILRKRSAIVSAP
jgi:RNA polymerase sigma-54 factor